MSTIHAPEPIAEGCSTRLWYDPADDRSTVVELARESLVRSR